MFEPDGSQLTYTYLYYSSGTGSSAVLDLWNLPPTGTYTVFITPTGTATGTITTTLWSDATDTLTIDGAATVGTLPLGRNGRYTFTGTAGQSLGLGISALMTTPPGQSVNITVLKPDQTLLVNCGRVYHSNGGDSCDLPLLPVAGTYTVVVDTGPWATELTLWLSSATSGTLIPNGSALVFSTSRIGQNASYSFAGTAGQNLSLLLSGDIFPSYTYSYVFKPDGSQLTYTYVYYSSGAGSSTTLNLNNLPITGTYRVFITPTGMATGSISTRLSVL